MNFIHMTLLNACLFFNVEILIRSIFLKSHSIFAMFNQVVCLSFRLIKSILLVVIEKVALMPSYLLYKCNKQRYYFTRDIF
jgi:hypothetical protein